MFDFDVFNEAFDKVSTTTITSGAPGLILILLFVIFTLAFGIPAVLKKSLKGVIIANSVLLLLQ
ncbi:hypothetical protein [Ferdinandcohnia sp. SAFN-114]|uniref:hypothetical protein n=1 Tax=Ferdinandcohnia sp. SAFN-114 TaxID=3387275 RepID=UPI003F7E54E4